MFSSSVWPIQLQPVPHEGMRASAAGLVWMTSERPSFVNETVVRSALVTCGLGMRLSTNADLQDFVTTDEFTFLITANGLWKTCLTSVLFSKMHYQALYCYYFVSLYCNLLYVDLWSKSRTDVDSKFWDPQILSSALLQQVTERTPGGSDDLCLLGMPWGCLPPLLSPYVQHHSQC